MYHKQRWTSEKIKQRLALIALLVYRKRKNLPTFKYLELASPLAAPPIQIDVDDSRWAEIEANTYWAQ